MPKYDTCKMKLLCLNCNRVKSPSLLLPTPTPSPTPTASYAKTPSLLLGTLEVKGVQYEGHPSR